MSDDMPDHEVLPPDDRSRIPHVGTYRRLLPVTLERMYENALDWAHLPYVHASSFSDIVCQDAGPWGWRAELTSAAGERSVVELRLDRDCRRWITRNLQGPSAGAEIWTHVFPLGEERLQIVVDFFVPDVAAEQRVRVGEAYARLYARLYDEDVAMMVERQRQLNRRIERGPDAGRALQLGPRSSLQLPLELEVGGRAFVLAAVDGELVVFPQQCPHQLGPLRASALEDGIVTCPWHGYRFDIRSGACVSGHPCELSNLPVIRIGDDGSVSLTAAH